MGNGSIRTPLGRCGDSLGLRAEDTGLRLTSVCREEPRYSLCGRHMSVKVGRRPPVSGDARLRRRHRDLGGTAGDQGGKDYADGGSVSIAGPASEQEPGGPPGALRSGRDAGIRRLEAKTVGTLDWAYFLVQPGSQVQKFPSAAISGEASSKAPPDLRGQRRGYEEASRLEFDGRIHTQHVLAHTKRVVNAPIDHSSYPALAALRTERRRAWQA
jgi:hypothetical protein